MDRDHAQHRVRLISQLSLLIEAANLLKSFPSRVTLMAKLRDM